MSRSAAHLIGGFAATAAVALASAQNTALWIPRDHPAVQYTARPVDDAIARLNTRIQTGEVRLAFDAPPRGYLASVLAALDILSSSQTLVFSDNSLQRAHISMATPRAIYFDDSIAVGWAKGAGTIEVTVQDPTQGVHFYSLEQKQSATPQFVRRDADCLQCHLLPDTSGVPGVLTMSMLPLSDNQHDYAQGWAMDHRTPIDDRWGGWYVTGLDVPATHLGNVAVRHVPKSYVRAPVAPRLTSGGDAFDTTSHLSPHSDVAALMVLNHQLHATNLLTRLGWQARIAAQGGAKPIYHAKDVRATARELADYMLFDGEAPLPSRIRGGSTFAADFASRGPHDGKGRSLRQLDLNRRLLRFPCSYMVYSAAFDALPLMAKALVYDRLWEVLSGTAADWDYATLAADDRRAIVEILRETKSGLPEYFQPVGR